MARRDLGAPAASRLACGHLALDRLSGSAAVQAVRAKAGRKEIAPIKALLLAAPLALTATHAAASTTEAWSAFHRIVAAKCVKASGLTGASTSAVIGFDDTLGKVVTLVSGRYPQPRLKGVPGRMLCVYDQKTGQTWVSEATGWSAPAGR